MKKFSFTSLWSVATLAIATIVLGGIATKAFAYTDADYLAFTPSGCSSMSIFHVNSGMILHGGSLGVANTIYVIDDVPASIDGNLAVDNDCVAVVANGDAIGNTVLNFSGGKYISSNGKNNIRISGFDPTHRLEILGSASPAGIIIENTTGATITNIQLSGFSILGGLIFSNTKNSTISNNIITNNKHGIDFQGSSLNNTISNNTITNNTNRGIWLEAGSNSNTISNNTITGNNDGLLLGGVMSGSVSNNTISNNTNIGISLGGTTNNYTISSNTISNNTFGISLSATTNSNTISNNTMSANTIGVYADGTKSNSFANNTISGNTSYGIYLLNSASGNVFTSETLNNANININIVNAQYNQFINGSIQSGTRGVYMNNATFNTLNGLNVISNSGVILNASSNNTLKLANNTYGIFLLNASNNNNILNTQILGQNNIFISNGANNIITGGLFTAASTTSTSVSINLRNNQGTPTYTITGAGLSGTYPTTTMTGSTGTVAIQLTATNNEVKNIIVTYNNGNMYYDSITLGTTNNGGSSNGGGGGGGGGGSSVSTCTTTQLVCSGGVRVKKSGVSCQGGNLGLACTVSTGTSTTTGTLIGSIVGSTYSTEINNAYLWSYANGITTMNTIQKANMGSKLIRSHMAKMISNFAIKFGGLTPDTTKSCTFDDVAGQTAEMKFYIKLSCQLGLMGQNMDSFDPNTYVTRAQFGTILSRVIWGDTYNGGTTYYTKHLTALKNAGIMTQISTPSMKEIRGYVMLMMMRTYEGGFLNN